MRIFVVTLVGLLLASCEEATTPVAGDAVFDLPADQVVNYMTEHLTTSGIRRADLQADSLLTFEQSRSYDMWRVKLSFYQDNGVQAGTLTADSANYEMSGGLLISRGHVVLITPTPAGGERKLETEELFYDVPGDRLWSDRPFELTQDGQVSTGTSFRSDGQFRNWEVSGARTEGVAAQTGTF